MMKNKLIALAAMMALTVMSSTSFAQSAANSNSGSESNSGSVSGAQSNNSGGNNAGIGNSRSGAVSGSNSASDSNSSSVGAANNDNSQSITFTSPSKSEVHYSGSQTLKNVPSVQGPNLTTSNDTCMGSTSGSINGPGFGIGLGSTWTDDNCVMLKNSRELWNMGMKAASMALMCTDIRTRRALQVTGFNCPNTLEGHPIPAPQVYSAAPSAPVADNEKYTDPYVRARLGLPPLKPVKQ